MEVVREIPPSVASMFNSQEVFLTLHPVTKKADLRKLSVVQARDLRKSLATP